MYKYTSSLDGCFLPDVVSVKNKCCLRKVSAFGHSSVNMGASYKISAKEVIQAQI
ncbi:MAG: hypothetical protein ACOH2V_09085 [Candidatus Saccharimonadaceae bacterium]